jgi:hypothetical protein
VLHWPRMSLKMNAIIWLRFRCLTLRISGRCGRTGHLRSDDLRRPCFGTGSVGCFQSANAVSRRSFLSLCGTATAARLGVISTRKPVAV